MAEKSSFNIVVLGGGGVGKTCIILRYIRDKFDPTYIPTIQDVFSKSVDYNGQTYTLQLVDTAGQDELQAITDTAFSSADAFCFVFSLTSIISLNEIDNFYNRVKASTSGNQPIILIGNKSDLTEEIIADIDKEADQVKNKINAIGFLKTSAKEGTGINDAFQAIIQTLVCPSKSKSSSQHNSSANQESGGCCEILYTSNVFLFLILFDNIFLNVMKIFCSSTKKKKQI